MSAALAPSFRRADGTPRRVLYAEDQHSSRIVTKAMLERMGFQVDAVEDGELALNAARSDNYDVILLDIEMPVMDGVTAARSIRNEVEHAADTPILALSAFLADSTEHTKWRDAFDSALPKPANSNELLKALRRAVQHKDERQRLPAKPTSGQLVDALKLALPDGVWRRLAATAAIEMGHRINVIAAADEAGDHALRNHAAKSLHQLAASFGAVLLANCALTGDLASMRAGLAAFS